jgi:hypothetical protein
MGIWKYQTTRFSSHASAVRSSYSSCRLVAHHSLSLSHCVILAAVSFEMPRAFAAPLSKSKYSCTQPLHANAWSLPGRAREY